MTITSRSHRQEHPHGDSAQTWHAGHCKWNDKGDKWIEEYDVWVEKWEHHLKEELWKGDYTSCIGNKSRWGGISGPVARLGWKGGKGKNSAIGSTGNVNTVKANEKEEFKCRFYIKNKKYFRIFCF